MCAVPFLLTCCDDQKGQSEDVHLADLATDSVTKLDVGTTDGTELPLTVDTFDLNRACDPLSQVCFGNQVSTCLQDGSGYIPFADCPGEKFCYANKCCLPDCTFLQCGSDGCGGSCGTCPPEDECEAGKCTGPVCVPDCTLKVCGDDGCGTACGECPEGEECLFQWSRTEDEDMDTCFPTCDTWCQQMDFTCGGYFVPGPREEEGCYCGDCPEDEICVFEDGVPIDEGGMDSYGMASMCACPPVCEEKECGNDGCGGACGTCPEGSGCVAGLCLEETDPCVEACANQECGNGGLADCACGECPAPDDCENGLCQCALDCSGKDCGDDGCGGSCGSCTAPAVCGGGGGAGLCGEPLLGMVAVPAGSFWMGCNEAVDDECTSGEHPYHQVEVPPFEIDMTEVTVGQYAKCVAADACDPSTVGSSYWSLCTWDLENVDAHPINCVDWYQAKAYCEWAGRRLCSAAEWEKAARGGCELYGDCAAESPHYPWGLAAASCLLAVMDDGGAGCGIWGTSPVGTKPAGASPYGPLDMAGGVTEWVRDCWHINYYESEEGFYGPPPTDGTAWEEAACADSYKTVRGGSWYYFAQHLRVSFREGRSPEERTAMQGFRCCK